MVSAKSFLFLLLTAAASLFGENPLSLDHAIVAIYAVDSGTGKVLAEHNSDLSLTPASCLKAITTAAALHLLGPEHRFETRLEHDGAIVEGTLHGNLYLRGGGDPCLGSDRAQGSLSWKEQIAVWADAIQKLGIQEIEGKAIPDASRWEQAMAVPSWCWEDLGNYYGAGASALSFHENKYNLFFKPGKKIGEETAILRTEPPLPHIAFQNEVKTGPAGSGDQACIYGSEFSNVQFIRGTVPAAVKEFAIKGAIPDPPSYTAELLGQELQHRGVHIHGKTNSPGPCKPIHTTLSPAVKEIVYWTNQKSINLYAEHLLKRMGEIVYGDGSTESGVKAVRDFWKSQNIDLDGFNMVDGSGLSRKNLITAKQFVAMLLKMKQSPYFPQFLESLPQVENGIRAKDGYMSLVHGYAGYKGDIVFAVLVNQCPDYAKAHKKILDFLSRLAIMNPNR